MKLYQVRVITSIFLCRKAQVQSFITRYSSLVTRHWYQRGLFCVAGQACHVVAGEAKGVGNLCVFVGEGGVEERWVVGVECDVEASVEQAREGVRGQGGHEAQADVAARAYVERYLAGAQFGNQGGVFQAAYAVADAGGVQQVQRVPYAGGAGLFACVGDGGQSGGAGAVEGAAEGGGVVVGFGPAQAKRNDAVAHAFNCPFCNQHAVLRGYGAGDVYDVAHGGVVFGFGPLAGAVEGGKLFVEGYLFEVVVGEGGVGDFGVDDVLRCLARQEVAGDVFDVVGGADAVGYGEVDLDEVGKVGKAIPFAQAVFGGGGQGYAVALRKREQRGGLYRALQVNV